MVRAILEGRKTQTRRVVKLPHNNPLGAWEPTTLGGPNGGCTSDGRTIPLQGAIWHTRTGECLASPYGQPGDRLWVREAWSIDMMGAFGTDKGYDSTYELTYKAGGNEREIRVLPGEPDPYIKLYDTQRGDWRPSIHMPRWACRLELEITGVRVERLNDCSEADAAAEGVEPIDTERDYEDWSICRRCGGTRLYTAYSGQGGALPGTDCLDCDTHLKRYAQLWDSINGDGAWEANPWVWVVEFRRIEA